MKPILEFSQVSFSYTSSSLLRNISFAIGPGDMTCLIGPNGSGKTTILRLATGYLSPARGEVSFGGEPIRRRSRGWIARRIAFVPQELEISFPFTVREFVSLGRTPYLNALGRESREDRRAVAEALELTNLDQLSDRRIGELSGGERQRAALAMALAQQPQLLLLDEPTVHLDIGYQTELLTILLELNRTSGLTVLATIHDVNLASLYFQRTMVLHQGQIVADGESKEAIDAGLLSQVYGVDITVYPHPTSGVPQIAVVGGRMDRLERKPGAKLQA